MGRQHTPHKVELNLISQLWPAVQDVAVTREDLLMRSTPRKGGACLCACQPKTRKVFETTANKGPNIELSQIRKPVQARG